MQGIQHGSYEYLKTTKVRDERKLMSIPNKRYLQSAMDKLGMSDCNGSVSPKLDKANMEGDDEELDEDQTTRFRSSVLTLLYLSPTALEMRQLKRLLRYVKGTEDMATVFEVRDNKCRREMAVKRLEVFTDSDWACDQVTR